MPNALYTRLQPTAQRPISKYRQPAPSNAAALPIRSSAVVRRRQSIRPMTFDHSYIDGTNILTSDRQIYVSSVGLAIVPQVGDIATAGGADFHFVNTDPNNCDGMQGRIAA
ncbi:hypothetical protein [Neorhizobium sp. DT-125]|uniref:hypothetical protein n=1 Tax=Neorhizobium sp. DT-125 TaxID=3396163 RepID=UPI003F1C8E18